MSNENAPAESATKPASAAASGSQLLIDLGPVAVFVVAYNVLNRITPDEAIYYATGIFIVTTLAAIGWCKFKRGKVPPVLIVTGVLVTAFGGLTLLLHNETFMKVKPTFVYFFYSAAIFGSLLIGKNIWRLLFEHVFTLPDRIWRVLALRWGAWFAGLGILNEVIRLTASTEFWVNSRLMIFTPLVIGFTLLNAPLVLKHAETEEEKPPQAPENPPS